MLYQVNYKYLHNNGKIRSDAMAVNADTEKDARKLATDAIKKEHDHFEITSLKAWK